MYPATAVGPGMVGPGAVVGKDMLGLGAVLLAVKDSLGYFLCDSGDGGAFNAHWYFTEHIEDVELGSPEAEEVLRHVAESYLDTGFDSPWKVAKVQTVNNPKLAQGYEEKRQELLVKGRKPEELEEKFGFFVENNAAEVQLVCSIGLQVRESEYNALGYNRQGVYLCKHADVCLQHSLVKHSGSQVMKMLMCMFVPGRPTTAIPRVASAAEFIEPTQGFDCHESVISPDPRDSLQNKFDRSQVYLYEINKLLQATPRPRQLMPYAVLSFTLGGAYTAAIDAEPTPEQLLASNARLQQALAASTAEAAAAASVASAPSVSVATAVGTGLVAVAPSVPTAVTATTSACPALVSPTTGTTLVSTATAGPLMQNGASQPSSPTGSATGPAVSPPAPGALGGAGEGDPALNKVVTQLNAKLGPRTPIPAPKRPGGRDSVHSVHSNYHASPAGSLPAPPQPPATLMYAPVSAAAGAGMFALSPHLAHLAGGGGVPAHLAQQMFRHPGLAGHHQLLAGGLFQGGGAGQAGLLHGQAGLLPTAVAAHPHFLQSQPHLFQAAQPGGMLMPFHMAANAANGLQAAGGGLQYLQHPGLQYPGLQHPGLQHPGLQHPGFQHPGLQHLVPMSMAGLMTGGAAAALRARIPTTHAEHAAPSHVPTAGYVANNVSGYTPANTGQHGLGHPIPVLANGVVISSAAAANMAAAQGHGLVSIAGMPGVYTSAALAGTSGMQHMVSLAGLTGSHYAQQGLPAGVMLSPSHANLLAQQQQQLKLAGMQHGLVPGAPGMAMPNLAMAQTLKRALPDPYAAAAAALANPKRMRLG